VELFGRGNRILRNVDFVKHVAVVATVEQGIGRSSSAADATSLCSPEPRKSLAVLLIGGITHQAIAAAWPVAKRGQGFFDSLRRVNRMSYANAIVASRGSGVAFCNGLIVGRLVFIIFLLEVLR
jgi:hypothetical protein